MANDWLYGFISGVLATIIGFVLTMAWDLWKDKRQTAERTRIVENAVSADLVANVERVRRNVAQLKQELPVLAQRMDTVRPLTLLRTGFWDIAKLYPPGQVVTSDEMTKLHDVFDLIEQVNEQIRSRETFRQHNGAMTNFGSRMKIYDDDLIEVMTQLEEKIMALDRDSTSTSPRPAA